MEIGSLDEVCEQLRQDVAAELESRPGKRWRCPVPLRSRIVSYAKVCRERGEPLLAISDRLGLVESTLARWLRADRKALALAPGFRSVSVTGREDCERGEIHRPIRLTTPAGYEVEGLDAQTLAFLLRVVG
jgi:hypothetical protein